MTFLAKKVMFSGALDCLFVVSNITQKVTNRLQWDFMEGSGLVKGKLIKSCVVISLIVNEMEENPA